MSKIDALRRILMMVRGEIEVTSYEPLAFATTAAGGFAAGTDGVALEQALTTLLPSAKIARYRDRDGDGWIIRVRP